MSFIPRQQFNINPFGDQLVSQKINTFSIKPTWGISGLREKKIISGTTADSIEKGGEILLSTGTDSSSSAKIETFERGQYIPGYYAEAGVAVRLPNNPSGTQFAEWGYFDEDNGIGYGIDTGGTYVFHKTNSSGQTKIYQEEWNTDNLSGDTNSGNPSGLELDLSEGIICQMNFIWYGYGTIEYSLFVHDPNENEKKNIVVHKETILNSTSVEDPNLPLTVITDNGGSTSSDFPIFLGGRQFSIYGNIDPTKERTVTESITKLTVDSAQDVWEPIMAVKKKNNFGDSGRLNSVNAAFKSLSVSTDNAVEYKLTISGQTTNGTFSSPTDWPSDETAAETKVSTGSLTASTQGVPISKGIVGQDKNQTAAGNERERIFIDNGLEIILFIRNTTNSSATISAVVEWTEQW